MRDPQMRFDISAMCWIGLCRITAEVWHSVGYCKCKDIWGRWNRPCVIGLEEIAVEKAEAIYQAWDALGLGYVGTGRRST